MICPDCHGAEPCHRCKRYGGLRFSLSAAVLGTAFAGSLLGIVICAMDGRPLWVVGFTALAAACLQRVWP